MKKLLILVTSLFIISKVQASNSGQPVTVTSIVIVSSNAAANVGATVTVSTPLTSGAFSTGYTNYITNVHIAGYSSGQLPSTITQATCTSQGFPVNPTWDFGTNISTNTVQTMDMQFANPLAGTQGSQIIVSCGQYAKLAWNIIVGYFVAP